MAVSPTDRKPEYDITLTDVSGTVLNLNLQNPLSISRDMFPRSSVQVVQGRGTYTNLEPPYMEEVQDDFSGGRGAKRLALDRTKYGDGSGVNTEIANQVTLQGQETYSTRWNTPNQNMPGSVSWVQLVGANQYLSESFVPPENFTALYGTVIIRMTGTAVGNLVVGVFANSAGAPTGAALATVSLAPAAHERGDNYTVFYAFTFSSSTALTSGTTYHLRVNSDSGSDTTTNCWEIATITTGGTANKSTDGSSWSSATTHICYALPKNITDPQPYFFEYKRGLYAVDRTAGANSSLWLNGDRGVADSNSGDKTKLNDATKSWTTNEWANKYVYVFNGPGSEEQQPWRQITSNTGTALTCSPAWLTTHTTETEYVIVGADTWQSVTTDLGGVVTGPPAIAGDVVYFPMGEDTLIQKYQVYNNAGAFGGQKGADILKANKLAVVQNNGRDTLWGTFNENDQYQTGVWSAIVPERWNNLYNDTGVVLARTDTLWGLQQVSGVTHALVDGDMQFTVDTAFATGIVGALALPSLNMADADGIGMLIKSSLASPSFDLVLSSRNHAGVGKDAFISGSDKFLPEAIYHYKPAPPEQPDELLQYSDKIRPSDQMQVEVAAAPDVWWRENNITRAQDLAWQKVDDFDDAGDAVYIGAPTRWTKATVDFQSANSNADTMAYYAWDGIGWNLLTVTDTTASGGNAWAQDGTWTLDNSTVNWKSWQKGGIPDNSGGTTSDLDQSLYWIKCDPNGLAITDVRFANIWLENLDDKQFVDLETTRDQDTGTGYEVTLSDGCWLMVGHDSKFNEVEFDLGGTVNAVTATMTAQYNNGETWTAVQGFSDGTLASGKTLAQDGTMTFYVHADDWQQAEVNGVTKYWLRLQPSADLTAHVDALRIAVKDTYWDRDQYNAKIYAKDGDASTTEHLLITTSDYVYIGGSEKFDTIAANLTSPFNGTTATLTLEYWNDALWTSTAITDGTASGGATLAQDGDIVIDTVPDDWVTSKVQGVEAYWVRLSVNANLTVIWAAELALKYADILSMTFPAMNANEWTWVAFDFSNYTGRQTILNNVNTIALNLTSNVGAWTITMSGGIRKIKNAGNYYTVGDSAHRVNNVHAYGEPVSVPYVFKENRPYSLDPDANVFLPVNLGEIETLKSYQNGTAVAVNDVYLYFNLGRTVQRYLQGALQNIGPELGEGLPSDRQGEYVKLLSYAGRIFLVVDAGSAGYSSVLTYDGGGWHEFYRAPKGERIFDAFVRTVDGARTDQLWLSVGAAAVHIPLPKGSFNPLHNDTFPYKHEGYLQTAWIDAEWVDILKLYRRLRVFTENLDSSGTHISFTYRLELGRDDAAWEVSNSSWITPASNDFTVSPRDSEVFDGADGLIDTTGYRMQIRFKFETDNNTVSPVLYAYVVEMLVKQAVKHVFNLNIRLDDGEVKLSGVRQKTLQAQTPDAQLRTWANNLSVLTLNSRFNLYNGFSVLLNSYGVRPSGIEQSGRSTPAEYHFGQVSLVEV